MPMPRRRPTREELLHTIEVCRRNLPPDAHPIHYQRLDYLETAVRHRERLRSRDEVLPDR